MQSLYPKSPNVIPHTRIYPPYNPPVYLNSNSYSTISVQSHQNTKKHLKTLPKTATSKRKDTKQMHDARSTTVRHQHKAQSNITGIRTFTHPSHSNIHSMYCINAIRTPNNNKRRSNLPANHHLAVFGLIVVIIIIIIIIPIHLSAARCPSSVIRHRSSVVRCSLFVVCCLRSVFTYRCFCWV